MGPLYLYKRLIWSWYIYEKTYKIFIATSLKQIIPDN